MRRHGGRKKQVLHSNCREVRQLAAPAPPAPWEPQARGLDATWGQGLPGTLPAIRPAACQTPTGQDANEGTHRSLMVRIVPHFVFKCVSYWADLRCVFSANDRRLHCSHLDSGGVSDVIHRGTCTARRFCLFAQISHDSQCLEINFS